jgi:hypothetical protein
MWHARASCQRDLIVCVSIVAAEMKVPPVTLQERAAQQGHEPLQRTSIDCTGAVDN